MIELISQIQDVIYESNLSDEEKKDYIATLEAMKDINFGEDKEYVEKALQELLVRVKQNPKKMKEFLEGIAKSMNIFMEKGLDGLIEELEKVAKS